MRSVRAVPLAGVGGEGVQDVQDLLCAPEDSARVDLRQLHHAGLREHVHVTAYVCGPNPELFAQNFILAFTTGCRISRSAIGHVAE